MSAPTDLSIPKKFLRGELLQTPIKSLDDARTFILGLVALDLLFHFEDDPADVCETIGSYTFQPCEVPLVRDRVRELYALPREIWGPDDCPIGFALSLTDPDWKNYKDAANG